MQLGLGGTKSPPKQSAAARRAAQLGSRRRPSTVFTLAHACIAQTHPLTQEGDIRTRAESAPSQSSTRSTSEQWDAADWPRARLSGLGTSKVATAPPSASKIHQLPSAVADHVRQGVSLHCVRLRHIRVQYLLSGDPALMNNLLESECDACSR